MEPLLRGVPLQRLRSVGLGRENPLRYEIIDGELFARLTRDRHRRQRAVISLTF